jgi:hypothetical protein
MRDIIHLIQDKEYHFAKMVLYRKYIQNYCNQMVGNKHIDILEAANWTGITVL